MAIIERQAKISWGMQKPKVLAEPMRSASRLGNSTWYQYYIAVTVTTAVATAIATDVACQLSHSSVYGTPRRGPHRHRQLSCPTSSAARRPPSSDSPGRQPFRRLDCRPTAPPPSVDRPAAPQPASASIQLPCRSQVGPSAEVIGVSKRDITSELLNVNNFI